MHPILIIVFGPLLAAVVAGLGNRALGNVAAKSLTTGALFVSAGGYHHHLGLNTWAGIGAAPPPDNAAGLRSFTIESPALQAQNVMDEATRVMVSMVRS